MSDVSLLNDIAIRVEGLSKRYRIGARENTSETLAGALLAFGRRPLQNLRRLRQLVQFADADHPSEDAIWALDDVSFEIRRGEILGVIGRNGAGKTTLLKILSQITEPTRGRAEVHGRVASLLEVGTGFHPELTGRENIYLNGTLLGMRKVELDRKLDAIVDFAGVGKFLDTPVKRYSSGMQVRLAFSVAAHLEPEILLVDEVLAVGDAEFQRKSLGKMRDVTRGGRTVFVVSHNMAVIRNLCDRVLLLERGRVCADGTADDVIGTYLNRSTVRGPVADAEAISRREVRHSWDRRAPRVLRCHEVSLLDAAGQPRDRFHSDEPISLSISYECLEAHDDFRVIVSVVDDDGVSILTAQNADAPGGAQPYRLTPGLYQSLCTFPSDFFGERRLHISLELVLPHVDRLVLEKVLSLEVRFAGYNNIQYMNHKEAFLRPRLKWETHPLAATVHG